MNTQQPEALRLAEWIEGAMACEGDDEIAAELRRQFDEIKRLHSVNAELMEALEWIVQYYRIEKSQNHMVSDYAKTAIARAAGLNKAQE